MPLNGVGRDVPDRIPGYGDARPFSADGIAETPLREAPETESGAETRGRSVAKVVPLERSLDLLDLRDGMTISFHHHLRDGDLVVSTVLDALARRGLRGLILAPTALFPVHESILAHVRAGVVAGIQGSVNGPVGRAASDGLFDGPVVLRSHGGRARAAASGELPVDVAFIAAPTADPEGNLSGLSGPSACGSLGYAHTDARYARQVVALTDTLVPYPLPRASIDQSCVDLVVPVERLGIPERIVSGTLAVTKDPLRLLIAERTARVLDACGVIAPGMSFQAGAGGISLAATAAVRERMRERKIRGSFASGGITGDLVAMHEEGLFDALLDVQSFDTEAVRSLSRNPGHREMSAAMYACPSSRGCVVDRLDAAILGATQVDVDFNVNVNTESDGVLLHGIGGHMDTAAGAGVTVIVTPLLRGRLPMVVDRVLTVTTPGSTVDVIVTERGVAVNPARADLAEALRKARLPLRDIGDLRDDAYALTGEPEAPRFGDRIIGVVEYRDGTVIDVIRNVV